MHEYKEDTSYSFETLEMEVNNTDSLLIYILVMSKQLSNINDDKNLQYFSNVYCVRFEILF